jgi:hypothetical protein
VAVGLLVLSTVLVGVTSEWLVDSIEGVSENYGVPKTFIGLILLPGAWLQHRGVSGSTQTEVSPRAVVSNAAEHATAVTASYKNKINLAMSVAVGSSSESPPARLWRLLLTHSPFWQFKSVTACTAVVFPTNALGIGRLPCLCCRSLW